MRLFAALLCGLLFGAGLVVAQMTDPAKVVAFLRLAPGWDGSLAFVMGGALAVTALLFPRILRRRAPLLAARFALPSQHRIDRKLIAGAALFGVGWGLSGLCPGPAVAGLGARDPRSLAFVLAMLAGMGLHAALQRLAGRARSG